MGKMEVDDEYGGRRIKYIEGILKKIERGKLIKVEEEDVIDWIVEKHYKVGRFYYLIKYLRDTKGDLQAIKIVRRKLNEVLK